MKENYIALREKQVVKANDLIQKSHFSLSLLQQKIVLYLISQIEYNDKDFRLYEFDIREFCKVCGIDFDNGGNYNYLKEQIKEIADKSLWITIEDEETLLRWIEKPYINRKEGVIKIRLDKDMTPFLLQLKANFTQYELIYTLHFKSKYTIRLYELIKSIHYHDLEPYERIYIVEELKKLLDAEIYKTYQHFREKVLDKAIAEINEYSDKIVSYEPIKIGRRIGKIKLKVETKETLEMLKIREQIDREMEFDPNQITFWDNEIKGGNGKQKMKTRLSVKAYAELRNTTPQAVYKRINKGTLKTEKEKINGKDVFFVLLDDEAPAEELNLNSTQEQPQEVELNPDIKPNSTPFQPPEVEKVVNDFNPTSTPKAEGPETALIAFLQEQLREKDRQIARLQEQTELQAKENKRKDEVIQEQLAKMNELLKNAQSLQAQGNLLLMEQNKPEEPTQEAEVIEVEQKSGPEPQKKRSWLYRFFFDI